MSQDDLRMPQGKEGQDALLGPQNQNSISRTFGAMLLSMVAIHYGGYALKNAGAKLLARHFDDVAFTSRRATSIAEDVFSIGRKLDDFSTQKMGQIVDNTPLGKEFVLRAQARAAQHAKRFPFEFIPAAMVNAYTRPASENQGEVWNIRNIGETVLGYAAADILIGAAWKPLSRTQAAQNLRNNMQRQGPRVASFLQKQFDEAAIRGSTTAKAMGTMYRAWQEAPPESKIPSPGNLRKIWQSEAKEKYHQGSWRLRHKVDESSLPWVHQQVRNFQFGPASKSAKAGMDSDYSKEWIRNLTREGNLSPNQAKSIFQAINIGQDTRSGFHVAGYNTPIVGNSSRWWTRFGHREDTIPNNINFIRTKMGDVAPQLNRMDDARLDDLFQRVTELSDQSNYRTWRAMRVPGARVSPSESAGGPFPSGILQEQQLRRMVPWMSSVTGQVDINRANPFGLRRVTVGESMRARGQQIQVMIVDARRRGVSLDTPQLKDAIDDYNKFLEFDEMVAAANPRGRASKFYQQWLNTAVDKNAYTAAIGREIRHPGEIIDFSLARNKLFSGIGKLSQYTKIPILGFNPIQLLHYRARAEVPEMRWVPTGAYNENFGTVTDPTLQLGSRLYRWRTHSRRPGTPEIRGALMRMPGEYKAYSTASNTITGRLVRNVMGMGMDDVRRFPGEKERFLYRHSFTKRIAESLDISPYTTHSIGATARNWMSGAPAWSLSQKLKRGHAPGSARYKFGQWLENKVPEQSFIKELDELVSGRNRNPDFINRVLRQVEAEFEPGIPLRAASNAAQWLPPAYSEAPFWRMHRLADGTSIPIRQPGLFTQNVIKDVAEGRRNLFNIIQDLEDDALAQRSRGNEAAWELYKQTLAKTKQNIAGGYKLYSYEEGVLGQFVGREYNMEDRIKRQILSYVLARPTTIFRETANRNIPRMAVMQVQDLDRLVEAISRHSGGLSSSVVGEVKGAVASIKLMAYRATIRDAQAQARAIAGDATIIGEMNELVQNWAKFPKGGFWRRGQIDPRNAQHSLNLFSDEFTYMKTFGSAYNENPAAAIQGIFGTGGTKTGISMGALHIVNRLRAPLKLIGLDFTEGKYSSMGDLLVGGFVARRVLPIMAAITAYQWLDWQLDKHTDRGLTEEAMRLGVVEPSIATAKISDALGIREGLKWFGKVTGEEDRMNALKYATMTGSELEEFWDQGEVPVRRGRWWLLSGTPFEGGRTQFFIPNLYQRIKSRYKYTWEGGRGPEEFHFSHSWLPNPSYPLAPLKRLTDPYAFEKATYHQRPYLLTGQFFNGPYGPVTPLLNATIGEFIKPTRQMHPEGWTALQTGFNPYGNPVEGVNWPTPYAMSGGAVAGGGPGGAGGMLGRGTQLTHAAIAGANSRVVGQAMTGGATVGQPYGIGVPATMMLMGSVGVDLGAVQAATPPGIWTQSVPMGNMRDTAYRMQEMAGIYGFSVQAVRERLGMAPEYQQLSYIPRANEATGFQNAFWNMQLGGMGDITIPGGMSWGNVQFSEIFRRFVPMPPKSQKINPTPNSVWPQNPWLPGPYSDYFEDFSVGDIYNRPYGALMLPGEGYMRAYGVQPDPGRGMTPYGPIDRLRILSKVAPWSREYRTMNRSMARMDLTPDEERSYIEIQRQVEAVNQKYQFAPYRFKGLELEERDYEITGITDEGYLQTRGGRAPIKLAGLVPGTELAQALRDAGVGGRMTLQFDVNRPRYSMSENEPVLEAIIPGLNEKLIDRGLTEDIGGSPLSYRARTNWFERTIGSAWESATHTWNPFTTKFIQRRTALEHYERTQIYGKDYAPWSQPIRSFVEPFFSSVGSRSLVTSVGVGMSFGLMLGRGPARPYTMLAGGALMGLNKLRTMVKGAITGEAYVPENVEERWEQEEYMDILQYVSAARNYSLLRRRAISAGEQDPETLWQKDQSIKAYMKKDYSNLQASVLERTVYGGISQKEYFSRNPIAEQAFSMRKQMGETAYGANLNGDFISLQRAIPKERRMFFEQFLNAPKSDRKRILSLLPLLERRIYESAWGMEVEPKPELGEYFKKHFLPGDQSAIWNSGVDWDKVRVRMIERAGERPSEYGYYPQEVQAAEMYPIPVPTPNMPNHENIKELLSKVLGGASIEGLAINVLPSSDPGFNVDFDITRNMYPQIQQMVNEGMR